MAVAPNGFCHTVTGLLKGNAAFRPCERSEAIRGIENGELKIKNDGARHFIILHSSLLILNSPACFVPRSDGGVSRKGSCVLAVKQVAAAPMKNP
jgi:hypothetical protein